MPTQTILSPGVQINEIDLSLRAVVPTGTNVLVLGFSNQGPIEEVFEIPDIQTFETIYGQPTNAAERYFYYSTRGVLDGGGRPVVARLPYGADLGVGSTENKYSCLAYPALPLQNITTALSSNGVDSGAENPYTLTDEVSGYIIGAPTFMQLTQEQYEELEQNNIPWADGFTTVGAMTAYQGNWFNDGFSSLKYAGFIVLNKFKSSMDAKTFEGYTFGITDSFDADPASDFTSISTLKYPPITLETGGGGSDQVSYYPGSIMSEIPASRRNFEVTSTATDNTISISRELETQGENLQLFQSQFIDSVSIGVFKLRQSIYTPQTVTLDYTQPDGYLGSLNSFRTVQDQNGGQPNPFYIGGVEDNSTYIQVLVNPYISTSGGDWTNEYGKPSKFVAVYHGWSDLESKWNRAKDNPTYLNTPVGDNTLGGSWDSTGVVSSLEDFLDLSIKPADALYGYGPTILNQTGTDTSNASIGNVPGKIDRIFQTIDDVDALQLDLSVEAGLGTVYAQTKALASGSPAVTSYDDTIFFNMGNLGNDGSTPTGFYATNGNISATVTTNYQGGSASVSIEDVKNNYLAVYEAFRVFAERTRKDHLFISDPLRGIFIQGAKTKILSNKSNTFVQQVYTPLKNLYDTSSTSFATVYANWALTSSKGNLTWIPFSGLLAGMMAADDATYAPWFAPAGFTRGKIPSPVLDLAVSPSQRNRDSIYKVGINPITKFPNDGITVFGQKTQLSTPSAFDRINVRRLFLYLEKLTRSTMKYFVFEPNTAFTRSRVIQVLRPQFEIVKNSEGMYDYLIVCDERNNTPEVIDQNQLIVDIYIKPTRAAEFILVNFYATRTDQDFNELI